MSPTQPIICTHERGRGTTVCLRCRHEEWQAAQRRRQQMLMRFVGLAFVVGIIGVAGAAGAITLRGGSADVKSEGVALRQEGTPAKSSPKSRVTRPPASVPATPEAPVATATAIPAATPAPVETPAPARTSAVSVLQPGRTTLTDSIFAVRSGDSVVVSFDTKGNRTRRADKLEGMIRLTLPMVYGRTATATLDSVPAGELLPSRDVTGALASQGLHLQLDNGVKIRLWPQTRDATDGPLVIAYLVIVER